MLRSTTLLLLSLVWATSHKLEPVQTFDSRIINGEEAKDGQFPWQVVIMGRSSTIPSYICGGALISEEWILTAGHCIAGAISATIYSGTTKISARNKTTSHAAEFILHEYFDEMYYNNDIGLIRLRNALTFNDYTQPIKLAEEELEDTVNVTVSGWGVVSDLDPEPYSDTLNYANVSTIPNIECMQIFGYQVVYPGLVCTGTGRPLRTPCLGDSGAPVVADIDTDPVHVAVFSFVNSYGCEFPYPAGNTRTAYFRDWIRNHTGI